MRFASPNSLSALGSFLLSLAFSCALYAQQIEETEDGVSISVNTEIEVESDEAEEKTPEEIAREEQEAAERAVRMQALSRELEVRQQSIVDLQSEQGIYYPGLIEAYSDIARLQVELEDFESATQSLNDALQIARINTGLYSEQQLPLIDELIDQNIRMQEWQEVDDLVHLDHHIASRVYDNVGADYLAAADDYGKWKLRLLRENLLSLSSQGLINTAEDLSDFYGRIILNVEFADEVKAEDLLTLLHGKSQADMSLARTVAATPFSYFQGTASRYITRTRCENRRAANGQIVRQCFNVQVENPRYRQSQRDAKRFMLNRHTQEINKIIERMQAIRMSDNELSAMERRQLDTQIAQLRAESEAVRRSGNRGFRF